MANLTQLMVCSCHKNPIGTNKARHSKCDELVSNFRCRMVKVLPRLPRCYTKMRNKYYHKRRPCLDLRMLINFMTMQHYVQRTLRRNLEVEEVTVCPHKSFFPYLALCVFFSKFIKVLI